MIEFVRRDPPPISATIARPRLLPRHSGPEVRLSGLSLESELVEEVAGRHPPKTVARTYEGIRAVQGSDRIRDSVSVSRSENLTALLSAVMALKALPWFPPSVRDIRAFRIEQWSDFTAMVKG